MTDADLLRAAAFAADQHRDQRRKGAGGAPYVNHVIEVAAIVAAHGGDRLAIVAALLHDTIEDTDASEADLRQAFGDEVTELVLELTDDKSLPKAERKRLQIERAPHKSPRAALIKLADKLSNVRDLASDPPPDWPTQRCRDYVAWARAVVGGLSDVDDELRDAFESACQAASRALAADR